MKNTEEMIRLNSEQAAYYDSIQEAERKAIGAGYSENRDANMATRLWAYLRYRQEDARQKSGIEKKVRETHLKWMKEKRGGKFLEVGCFQGSRFTFDLIEESGEYVGIDLSSLAIETLNKKISQQGLSDKAQGRNIDFLTLKETSEYDLIYAFAVLHHFENPEPLFAKLRALLRPGGIVIFTEPSTVNPVFKIARHLYRPFQSDAEWEWPFTLVTVKALERHLRVCDGFGWGCYSLFLSLFTSIPILERVVLPLYIKMINKERIAGWHTGVWSNSYVTAKCEMK